MTTVETRCAADDYDAIDIARIREHIGYPIPKVVNKITADIGELERRFIAHSPFMTLATHDASGRTDCSPRGDRPGFVRVLDARTLAIPNRLGNNLADSLQNICECPDVGMLFLVPGLRETLRINGQAKVVDAPALLDSMVSDGKRPTVATVVKTEEVYLHCGKALIRSDLWNSENHSLAAAVTLNRHVEALQAVANGALDTDISSIAAESAADLATVSA